MLFLLSSGIQSGKTRWLEQLIQQLSSHHIPYAGVLAPGVWRQLDTEGFAALQHAAFSARIDSETAGPYEKLGIDNILLPSGERIAFARRTDLLEDGNNSVADLQDTSSQLDWVMYTEAIERVNTHFQQLEADAFGNTNTTLHPGVLIVDEIGRMELQHNDGLVAAKKLLQQGPSHVFPHAVVTVRSKLLSLAEQEFSEAWGTPLLVSPTSSNLARVCNIIQSDI